MENHPPLGCCFVLDRSHIYRPVGRVHRVSTLDSSANDRWLVGPVRLVSRGVPSLKTSMSERWIALFLEGLRSSSWYTTSSYRTTTTVRRMPPCLFATPHRLDRSHNGGRGIDTLTVPLFFHPVVGLLGFTDENRPVFIAINTVRGWLGDLGTV